MRRIVAAILIAVAGLVTVPSIAYAKNGATTVPLNPHFANKCPSSIVWDATVGTVANQAILVVLDRNNQTRQWVPATTAGVYGGEFTNISITGGQHEAVISLYQNNVVVEHHDITIPGTQACGL